MKKVVDKGFLKTNAIAGFEASGLWPLNRPRIANEKLQIGSVFGFSVLDESLHENIDGTFSETPRSPFRSTPATTVNSQSATPVSSANSNSVNS